MRLLVFAFILLTFSGNAQVTFDPGHFTDNSGQRTECFIDHQYWQDSPEEIHYKLTADGEILTRHISQITDFGSGQTYLYKRFQVEIDEIDNTFSRLANNGKPVYRTKTLFLKVLVSGQASLYQYKKGSVEVFFYSMQPSESPKQLIYKEYRMSQTELGKNTQFRQDLYNAMKERISLSKIERTKYREKDLTALFREYSGVDSKVFEPKFVSEKAVGKFQARVIAGASFATMSLQGASSPQHPYVAHLNQDLSGIAPFFGVEGEYILPFSRSKFSVFAAPNVHFFKSDNTSNANPATQTTAEAKYQFIEIPLGVRYYMHLNNKSSLFLNGSFNFNLPFGSSVQTRISNPLTGTSIENDLEPETSKSISGGIGYQYNRFMAEARFTGETDPFSNVYMLRSSYSAGLRVVVSYRFL